MVGLHVSGVAMSTVSKVLSDLDQAMAARSDDQRATTAARVADLFVNSAGQYSEEQIDMFGAVLGRLAANVAVPGRVQLSERLADVANAPTGIIRQFALDEIAIARPVLTRSPRLSDQDLIAVASSKGHSHMLAITERPHLAEPVTDYLVVKGDRVISHGLAVNQTARFSRRGMGLLVTRALTDDSLQSALGQRRDLPDEMQANLAQAVSASAKRRLMGKTATGAITINGAGLARTAARRSRWRPPRAPSPKSRRRGGSTRTPSPASPATAPRPRPSAAWRRWRRSRPRRPSSRSPGPTATPWSSSAAPWAGAGPPPAR